GCDENPGCQLSLSVHPHVLDRGMAQSGIHAAVEPHAVFRQPCRQALPAFAALLQIAAIADRTFLCGAADRVRSITHPDREVSGAPTAGIQGRHEYRSLRRKGSIIKAIVIGSGFGGLALAIRLQSAGIDTLVLEKRDKPGG